mmetsp:Transcript_58487/g.187880  ORF Transcript_58487/g.187880 Transcript_58487/m.187880 type:complete len:231 (-) Transcript_58487:973-1665(-)
MGRIRQSSRQRWHPSRLLGSWSGRQCRCPSRALWSSRQRRRTCRTPRHRLGSRWSSGQHWRKSRLPTGQLHSHRQLAGIQGALAPPALCTRRGSRWSRRSPCTSALTPMVLARGGSTRCGCRARVRWTRTRRRWSCSLRRIPSSGSSPCPSTSTRSRSRRAPGAQASMRSSESWSTRVGATATPWSSGAPPCAPSWTRRSTPATAASCCVTRTSCSASGTSWCTSPPSSQ